MRPRSPWILSIAVALAANTRGGGAILLAALAGVAIAMRRRLGT